MRSLAWTLHIPYSDFMKVKEVSGQETGCFKQATNEMAHFMLHAVKEASVRMLAGRFLFRNMETL